ncbi:MAG: AtpZ/AtpI family protein [Chloroflexi bacterium]|nr:AtpZ/AtpI family protein [Chloroflexota bacterium]MBK6712926.1 AtpZ/AtpI family protein [Chloroflexota bacterium]MBK7177466.1 AtpZ/AtpI family protein [Chloroflexota bacterium]MBK7918842.1 AtpZ/AtpI family protein [Chloroflexota bacterium]MBK8931920.1 AtpZ/AtpI family protein [Chloroflexota bacterium]
MTNLVGQVGCVTGLVALVIIGVSFGLGQFLDSYLGTRGIFTVVFMLGSFPVTLFAMVRLSLMMVARAQARVAEMDTKDTQENNETT